LVTDSGSAVDHPPSPSRSCHRALQTARSAWTLCTTRSARVSRILCATPCGRACAAAPRVQRA